VEDICQICGCTDEQPCTTKEGPCSWAMKNLCSACIVVLGPGENCYDNVSLIIRKECRNCANLEEDKSAACMGFKNYHHCTKGRFNSAMPDGNPVPGCFAWSGISRPNKAVALARKRCPFFEVHERFKKK